MTFKIQNQTSANHCMEFTTISHNGLRVIKAANGTSPSDWLEHKGIVTNLQLIVFFFPACILNPAISTFTVEVVSITH